MAAFRFSRTEESQVDPFNAGDPVLPGGEPEALAEADEPEGQVEYMAHGESGGTPHKPGDNYQAPTTRGHDYDAPSIDEPSRSARTRPRRSRTAPATPTAPESEVGKRTEKDRRVVTRVIVLLVILVSFGSSLASCVSSLVGSAVEGVGEAAENLGDALFDDGSEDWGGDDVEVNLPEQTAKELAAANALEERLDALLAGTGAGSLRDRIASYFERKTLEVDDYSASELGIDSEGLADFVLGKASVEAGYAYTYDDGTASAYAEVTSCDSSALFWELHDAYGEYLLDNDLWGRDDAMPTEEQRAHVEAMVEEVLAAYDETYGYTYSFELELSDGAWVVDERGLDDSLEAIFGLY